ncbi:MAG: hypothetical protein ACLFS3_00540 [Candidatus Aenigmatarchaeota archaeon]
MPEDFFDEERKRAVTKARSVEEIDSEDKRVAIIGTVVDKQDGMLMVDDGTGKIEVETSGEEQLKKFDSGDVVRVVGRVGEGIIYAEAVQDFSNFDRELYQKAREKLEEFRS